MRDRRSTLERWTKPPSTFAAGSEKLAGEPFEPEVVAEIHELSSWLDNIDYAKWSLERRRAALERLLGDDEQRFSVLLLER